MIAVVAALVAATGFAASTALQHRATTRAPAAVGGGLALVGHLVRQPLWLLGALLALAGAAAQAVALADGQLVVVQPLLTAGLVLVLPMGVLLGGPRPRAAEWAWAALVAAGLALFLVAGDPGPGRHLADPGRLAAAVLPGIALALVAALAARWRAVPAQQRALLTALAGGLLLGVAGALLKQVLGLVTGPRALPLTSLLTTWPGWLAALAALAGVWLTQASYRTGSLVATQPAHTAAEPAIAAVIGVTAFHEQLARTPPAVVGQVVGALLVVGALVALAVLQDRGHRAPGDGHGGGDPDRGGDPDGGPEDAPDGAPTGAVHPVSRPAAVPEDAAPPAAGTVRPATRPARVPRARVPRPRPSRLVRSQHPRRVLIISGSVGAGHDGAAHELARRLRARGVEVEVRDHLDALPRIFTHLLRDGYTLAVGRVPQAFEGLFAGIERRRSLQLLLEGTCGLARGRVMRWVRASGAQVVVSTYPLASQTLGQLRRSGQLRVPVVTYLTDPAAHRSWVHPAVDHHVTVTRWTAEQGSAGYGVAMRAAGPLVPERFAPCADADARALAVRAELGLAPQDRVALLVAGSLGLGDVDASAARIAAAGLVPLVLCGRNEDLQRRVAAVPGAVALGWRDDVDVLLRAADVLVHNAGGMSYTEALVTGLPAVSFRCIPGHGRANAAVLDAAGLAPWVREDADLGPVLHRQAALGRRPGPEGDPADDVLAVLEAPVGVRRHRVVIGPRRLVPPAGASSGAASAGPPAGAAPTNGAGGRGPVRPRSVGAARRRAEGA